MNRRRLARLRRMSWHEWRWRSQDALFTLVERAQVRAGTRWNRGDLATILSGSASQVCARNISRGRWELVQRDLEALVLARPARFVLDPSSAPAVRDHVSCQWPDAAQHAAARADRLLDGSYDLLGYSNIQCAPGGRIDWHADPVHSRRAPRAFYADIPYLNPELGDHKVIWELNRHQHFLQLGRAAWLTGDERYGQAICSQIAAWLPDNPPFVGINWASMLEIGFRSLSWTWALHCLLGVPRSQVAGSPWLVDLLIGLDRQLTHVERHLSYYFSPNTHLTGEALALYVVGTALPELGASHRWADTGRRVLLEEIGRQILNDGGHVERSTHYQRYTLDFYLLATQTARLAGDLAAADRFGDAARRAAAFTRTIADADGHLPLIGDDDGGMLWPIAGRACADVRDSLALAGAVLDSPELAAWGPSEEMLWIGGANAALASRVATRPDQSSAVWPGQHPSSRLLPDAGYFVASAPDGSHAVFDVGAHGYRNGGHAHADALSITLSVDRRAVLIDPGTSTYTMDAALRDRMRSSVSHNTVTIDGRSQSVPAGPFHWLSTVDAEMVACRRNPSFDWIEAVHDGYRPVLHRRTLVRTRRSGWLVVDSIVGPGPHTAAAHWHIDPAWQLADEHGRLRLTHANGGALWMLVAGGEISHVRGDHVRGLGWCAPVYGQLEPTWTVRLATTADAPFGLVTWIGNEQSFASPALRCTHPMGLTDRTVVVEVRDQHRTAVFLVRPAGAAGRACRVGEFETDAAMLHYVEESGRLTSLSMAGGRHCLTSREGWPSVASDTTIRDLHLDLHGDDLVVESMEPPDAVQIYGTAGRAAVRTNGGDLPLSSKSTTGAFLIRGSDWLPFRPETPRPPLDAKCGVGFAPHGAR